MIKLNLLPRELRREKEEVVESTKLSFAPVCAGIVAILLTAHFVLMALVSFDRRQLKELDYTWEGMKPEREKTNMVVEDTTRVKKHLTVIRGIAKPYFSWTKMLSGLNQAIIENVWMDKMELEFSSGMKNKKKVEKVPVSFKIAGYALGNSQEATSLVAKFINSLKSAEDFSDYFSEIELKNMRNYEIEGSEVMRFMLDCRLKNKSELTKMAEKTKT